MFRRLTSQEQIHNLDPMISAESKRLENTGATMPSDLIEFLFEKRSHFFLDMIQEQLNTGRASLKSRSCPAISPSVNECKQYGPYFINYTIEQIEATVRALGDDIDRHVAYLVETKTKKIPDWLKRIVRQLEIVMLAKITIELRISNVEEGHGIWREVATPRSSGLDLSLSLSNGSVPPAPHTCPPFNSLDSWSEEPNGGSIFKEDSPSIASTSSAPIRIPRPNKKKSDPHYLSTYGMYSTDKNTLDKNTSDKDTSSIASSSPDQFRMSLSY